MKITVTISDELAAHAEARGLSIEVYVQSLVQEAERKSLPPHRPSTPEQIEAFFEGMAEGSQKLPLLPTESFTRESFYQDRIRVRGPRPIPAEARYNHLKNAPGAGG